MPDLVFTQKLDAFLNKIYGYQGVSTRPTLTSGQIWAMPNVAMQYPWLENAAVNKLAPGKQYFLHYYQNQGYGPTNNECVTTSAIIAMNIMDDWLAAGLNRPSQADKILKDYTSDLDARGVWGWLYRFSTNSPLPGMMTPWQAVIALKHNANKLKKLYGKSYRVKLSARNTLKDLIQYMQDGKLMLLHGAWHKRLHPPPVTDKHLAYLGGGPHTMLLVGYDGDNDSWILLNPAHPWPVDKTKPPVNPRLYSMTTKELLEFWGRQFLFYPPRFAITTITPDA